MRQIKKRNKRIIAVTLIGIIVLIGVLFVIYPGRIGCSYTQPPSKPYIYNITPDPDTDGNIYIHWDPCLRVEDYTVFIYIGSSVSYYTYKNVGLATSYTIYDLSNGVWGFEVVADNCAGTSGHSSRESVTVAIPSVPSVPTLYTITPDTDTDGIINLRWSTVSDATSYKVYRSKESGSYAHIATVTGTSYTDSGIGKVGQSIIYNYKIRAFNQYGGSVKSNKRSVTVSLPSEEPLPSTPILNTITPDPDTDGNIHLTWSASTDVLSYFVNYKKGSAGFVQERSAESQTYIDISGLSNGLWYFQVEAMNNKGSVYSTWKTVTVDIPSTPPPHENEAPIATITSISPNPAEQGVDIICFSGSGSDTDGTITDYEWSSDIDGVLSTLSTFSKSADELSIGQHMIYFRVKDDEKWSSKVSEILTIEEEEVVIPKPNAPILYDITPSRDTDGTIQLSWSIDENAESYNIYRDGICIKSGLTVNTYTDRDLDDGTYTYIITAVNEKGESDRSNEGVVIVDISGEVPPEEEQDLTRTIILLAVVIVGGIGVIYFTRRLKRKLVG